MKPPKHPRKIGDWTVNGQDVAFENPWLRVIDYDVLHPNGSAGRYGVVRFKNRAIGVLPIDKDGMVTLVGQHRFPLDDYSWELPEGGGPLDEAPLSAAKRELKEETGFSAGAWFEFARFDISNSVTDEEAVCFLAADLAPGAPEPDETEVLQRKTLPFSELHDLVLRGEIRDSLTIVMVLTARAKALRGAFPPAICALLSDR
ncbi:MAG: NUDIX hydrolase [Pseudomonadota bacterium]